MAQSKISLQQTHRGVVVVANFNGEFSGGYGFIEPAGSDGRKESNVFFGAKATQGLNVERGDEVDYVLNKKEYPGRNRGAYRVWVRKPAIARDDRSAITNIAGEFDT